VPAEPLTRRRELEQLERLLELRAPALALICGEDGMGKTRLLAALEERARERRWATVRTHDGRSLRIGESTTEREFLFEVEEFVQTPLDRGAAAGHGALATAPAEPLHPLVARLQREAPIVLLIDGFRPSEALAAGWTAAMLPALRRSETPIVVVVADRADSLEPLRPHADTTVELGALDPGELAGLLRAGGEELVPPLSDDELAVYIDEAGAQPHLLAPLLRVLELVRRPATPEAID
jgi:hypothetical protein